MKAMGGNDKERNGEEDLYDLYYGVNIQSQNDCTGMIPTPPLNEGQLEGYRDIYSMPQQCSTGAQKQDGAKEQKKKSSIKGEKDMPLG